MSLLQRWFEHYKQNSIVVGFFTHNTWHQSLLMRAKHRLENPSFQHSLLRRVLPLLSKLIIPIIIVTGVFPIILIMDLIVAPIASIYNLFSKKTPSTQSQITQPNQATITNPNNIPIQIILTPTHQSINDIFSASTDLDRTRKIEEFLRSLSPLLPLSEINKNIIETLLSSPEHFRWIEQHNAEYGHFVTPFVEEHLELLEIGELNNTNVNIQDHQKIQLYYLMTRRLIRLNDRNQLPKIILLLSIPAVQAIAAQANNELLRLARRMNNYEVIEQLAQIPCVLENARAFIVAQAATRQRNTQNDHPSGLGLRQIAQDRENAMRALSVSEQDQLTALTAHYDPMIQQQGGLEAAWNAFIESLKSRYSNAPASLDNQPLPLDWNAFERLNLTAQQRAKACQQYYQHPLHTAIRFLSKPNHWLHSNAGYLATTYPPNGQSIKHQWADFERYKPLILCLWLAAKDAAMPPTITGMSVENRIEFLIKSLALTGRRHNFDNHRPKKDHNNQTMQNAAGQIITEEYDDGEGDRPSCFSGMNVEFFQALIGHPLFAPITKQTINTEIIEFMRTYLARYLKNYSAADINQKMVILDTDEFTSFNVTQADQESFVHRLKGKYPQLATPSQTTLLKYLTDRLSISGNDSHICRFWQEANLEQLCLLHPTIPAVIFEPPVGEETENDSVLLAGAAARNDRVT